MVEVGKVRLLAAQYVRKSTEHQKYSIECQMALIRDYAALRDIEITQTYIDSGRSGLRIDDREALKQLISDVQSGRAAYDAILVYDVSRWGRFQDSDESAYYEYICKRAGISVHYCAEQFDNDGSPLATIIKSIKRAMAGEYSRELSVKVFAGQRRIVERGFRLGGRVPFGFRRAVVDQDGRRKHLLMDGQRKSIQTDRITLVPGPPRDVAVVKQIYRAYVREKKTLAEIAAALNRRGLSTNMGLNWRCASVVAVLTNPNYVGDYIWNRTSVKLKKDRRRNPSTEWIRAPNCFQPIVERSLFDEAQKLLATHPRRQSNADLLEVLRTFLTTHGKLSEKSIRNTPGLPSVASIQRRFGGLAVLYQLLGFRSKKDLSYAVVNRTVRKVRDDLAAELRAMLQSHGAKVTRKPAGRCQAFVVNGKSTVHVVIMKCQKTKHDYPRWRLTIGCQQSAGLTVVVRMDENNLEPVAYYLIPRRALVCADARMAEPSLTWLARFELPTFQDVRNRVREMTCGSQEISCTF